MNPTPADTEALKEPNPAAAAHAPRQASPVMDVVPPRPSEKFLTPAAPAATTPPATTPASPATLPAPVAAPAANAEGLATPPPETEDEKSNHDARKVADSSKSKEPQQASVKLRPASNSVAGIIAITVSVIAILSGLAVYAYLQSQQ